MTDLFRDFCALEFIMMFLIATFNEPFMVTSALAFKPPADETSNQDEDQVLDQSSIPWDPTWDDVVRCKPGDMHTRFPECHCGQYAHVLNDEDVQLNPLEDYHWKWKRNRKVYYTCFSCSTCPDGVRMTGYCGQGHDTSCDPDLKCIDPGHVFDTGIKACGPRHTDEVDIEEPGVNDDMLNSDGNDHSPSTDATQTKGYSAIPQSSSSTSSSLMLALVCFIGVVGLEIFICIVILLYRRCTGRGHQTLITRVPSDLAQSSSASRRLRCLNCIETRV